jgi:hypothetical protein
VRIVLNEGIVAEKSAGGKRRGWRFFNDSGLSFVCPFCYQ